MTTDIIRHNGDMGVMDLGRVFAKSGYFNDARDEAQAIVKILAGNEMGIAPVAAMMGIYLIKGRIALSANLMASKIKGSGKYDYKVRKLDDQECTIEFFQGAQSIGVSTFTAADAKKAGTQNMSAYPRNMLFARALSNGAKWYTPDAFNGTAVYTPDELAATAQPIDGTGEYIDVTPEPEQPVAPVKNPDTAKYISSVQSFINVAIALDVEITDNRALDTLTTDELIANGTQLRTAIVERIQRLSSEYVGLGGDAPTDDRYLTSTLMKAKPSDLRAIGLGLIRDVREARAAVDLALAPGATFEPTEGELVEESAL